MAMKSCQSSNEIRKRIKELESELTELKSMLEVAETKEQSKLLQNNDGCQKDYLKCQLTNKDIERFSRQMILPEIGVKGQIKIQKSSILVVGTGGLGCPAALYLTSAGIGTIGLVDYDTVDLSNLHRQVLHTEDKIGLDKVESAIQDLKRLNSSTQFVRHSVSLTSVNALDIIQKYDIVLDCTDNVATRYLLNDACIFSKKPLVSGSALRFEGQLIVYNYMDGPCYRCLYPNPPPAETVTNCSDGGVIGAVTGVIGSLQALEAIKIITNENASYAGKLLLYDGFSGSFRLIKLRGRKETCPVCGKDPEITTLQDYEQFCGAKATDKEISRKILDNNQRISVEEYLDVVKESKSHILVDVRPNVEYEICSLQPSINITLNEIDKNTKMEAVVEAINNDKDVFVVCKRGNDSQAAVQQLLDNISKHGVRTDKLEKAVVKDLIGGLHLWSCRIDSSFPKY